jgi:prepilin-type N-terminal cleavage/methylation domain-containing protein
VSHQVSVYGRSRRIPPKRKGFILLEVIVAIFILGIVLSSLAALLFQVSQGSFKSIGGAYRNGVLLQEVNRLEAVPYDQLALGTTTTTVTDLPYPHTRTVTVTNPATNLKSVILIIQPAVAKYKPDTAKFIRTLGATTSTFNNQ